MPYIIEIIGGLKVKSILDGFSGSTRVSQALAQLDYDVTSNDISVWSEVLATCYLLTPSKGSCFRELIAHLNGLCGYEGWFSQHYGAVRKGTSKRPFQLKNTKKLDAIIEEIDALRLNDLDKSVALTSLILALDSVDSTLGHYVSYLADWSPRAYNNLVLKVPALFASKGNHQVIRKDIFQAIKNKQYDLAYYDPPYGSNNEKMPPSRVRYASYYHLWTTVILNDKPQLFGKANRRTDTRDIISSSIFEDFRKNEQGDFIALQAIYRLIRSTHAKYILLSYSSGGRATKDALMDIIHSVGRLLNIKEIDYKQNVMRNMRSTNAWANNPNRHVEYLFLIEKIF